MNEDTIRLTTPQWETLTFLQKMGNPVWAGGVNKRVWASLVKKGLLTVDKNYNLTLTKAGKQWESPKSIKL